MEEILVALACLQGAGCTETYSQYYKTHKELQTALQVGENTIRQNLPDMFIKIATPTLAWSAGYKSTVHLYKGLNWEVSKNGQGINYSFSF